MNSPTRVSNPTRSISDTRNKTEKCQRLKTTANVHAVKCAGTGLIFFSPDDNLGYPESMFQRQSVFLWPNIIPRMTQTELRVQAGQTANPGAI